LHLACHKGNEQIASYLLKEKKVDPNVVTTDLMTPLHLAIFEQHVEIVMLLVEHEKTDIDAMPDEINGTPLHCAVRLDNLAIVFLLLMHKADSSIEDRKGHIPKDMAKSQEIVALIWDYEIKEEKLNNEITMSFKDTEDDSQEANESTDVKFLSTLEQGDPFLLISKTFHKHKHFLHKSIHSLYESYFEEFINYEPFRLLGYLKTVGTFKINSATRYWIFSCLDGIFMTYKSPEDVPRKYKNMYPLYMIEDMQTFDSDSSDKPKWFINSKYTYFQIVDVNGGKATYFSKNPTGIETWVTAVKRAKKFHQWFNYIKSLDFKEKEERQKIMDLLMKIAEKHEAIMSVSYDKSEEVKGYDMNVNPPTSPTKGRKEAITAEAAGELEHTDHDRVSFESFEMLSVLGEGSFGKVFLVKMKNTEEEYAMKVLKKSFLVSNRQLKYAVSEWSILRQLKHPFVVSLHYSFQTAANLYMVLDYCPKGDLMDYIEQKVKMNEDQARFVMWQIILAIRYLHSHNIVYRDMKPENVLIDSENNWKLADFGLAKEGIEKLQIANSFCGSPAYLPPELLLNNKNGKEGDYYQLGVLLYELLVGMPPFYSDNMNILYQAIQRGKYQMPFHLSVDAQDLISKLLEKKPKKRLADDQILTHPFFKDVDWKAVEEKSIPSPLVFEGKVEEKEKVEEEWSNFQDEDYLSSAETLNRVRGFTFRK
jgi:serine/threonine protein kinase